MPFFNANIRALNLYAELTKFHKDTYFAHMSFFPER